MSRKGKTTRPMKGRRMWVENTDPATLQTDGRWKIRVVLQLFGAENEVFLSNEWYHNKRDAYNNYRLIFFGEWEELDEECNS